MPVTDNLAAALTSIDKAYAGFGFIEVFDARHHLDVHLPA